MQLHPYLTFNGQCKAAFEFYEKILGGKIEAMQTHGGSPLAKESRVEWRSRILHARLAVGDYMLMGSDGPPDSRGVATGFYVSIQVDDAAEAERVFHALAAHGKVQKAIAETFWAVRFGMLVDQFGIAWMVNCDRAR